VVDNGSTDETSQVIAAYADRLGSDRLVPVILPVNVCAPAARNWLMRREECRESAWTAFLDDDAVVQSADLGTQLRARFGADPRLGGVSFRIVDPESGRTAQRHVPRPGGRGLEREGRVTSFLGGASALSGPMFRSVDGYCAEFFYAHEESDLAWRAIAAGWRFTYAPSLVVTHPLLPTTRHAGAIERSMRNRVWLVRRNLPLPVGLLHLVIWLAIGLVRTRSVAGARAMIAGFRAGWAGPPPSGGPNGAGASGASALVRWRLCWRLTRLGRPPLL